MSHESFQAPEIEQLAELLPSLEFQSFIAQGGMGAVYKARQRSLDRDVAVKILPRELGNDPEFHQSFETEAKAMARLNHPNLISVYDFGDVDGMPYIVMEYVDGKSLYHSAWNKQIEPRQAVEIAAGICRGLAHAHESGVIHRDIKPANILLTRKAEPKIGDFGLARPVDHDGPGLVMGTPGYTAPEVLTSHEQADVRSDLYAVGVILHELITGQRPDPSGSPPKVATGNLRLDTIWRKATQPDPNRRYPTAEAMAEALEGWLRNPGPNTAGPPPATSPTPAAKSSLAPRAPAAAPAGDAPPATPGMPAATQSNWSLVRNLLIIAVLLIAIGFVYKAYEAKKKDNATKQAEYDRQQYEQRRQAEVEARRQAEEAAARLAAEQAARKPEIQPAPPKPESPLESLARLRTDLAAGGRAEMPIGTIRKGDRELFFVEQRLGWHEAAAFAEDHGGHLAIVTSEDDLTWFIELLPRDTTIWLGAGRSLGDKWVNLDGSNWLLNRNPPGSGAYASINDLGVLRSHRAADRFPFIIQWHRDGSNPATLAAMLRSTRETLGSPSPIFPPGTEAQDARRFAIIPRELPRREAERLAAQAGGILAVPATKAEADWLDDRVAELDASAGFWLGGSLTGDLWGWDTGEAWSFARWRDDNAPRQGTALVLVPGNGWKSMPPEEAAAGFIIEWSDDAAATAAKPEDMADADAGLADLRKKAAQLVAEAIRERDDKLSANARTFTWDLDVWLRGLNHGDRDRWRPHLERLKQQVRNDRIPSPEDLTAIADSDSTTTGGTPPIELSEQMAKVCTSCFTKQQKIDAEHEAKLGRIRDAYVQRLRQSAEDAQAKGQTALVNQLREAARQAEDLDTWAGSFGP